MSQRGPAPRPASGRSSKSPPVAGVSPPQPSQPGSQRGHVQRHDPRVQPHEPGARFVGEEGARQLHPANPRTSVVRNILNPSDHPNNPYGGTMPPVTKPPMAGDAPPGYSPGGPYGSGSPPHPYVSFHGQQPHLAPQPAYSPLPPSSLPPRTPSVHERASPSTSQPYSPLGSARRVLTPKSPRVSSLGRAALMGVDSARPPLPPHMASHGNIMYHHDMGPRGVPPQFRRSTPVQSLSQGAYDTPTTTTPPPSRSLSQSMLSYGVPPGHYQEHQQPTSRPPMNYSGPPFTSALLPGRSHSTPGLVGDGRWAAGFLGQMAPGITGAHGMPMEEGQHLLTITPSYGEEILVPVDTHQASKQSDEKRQRNAGASARFRMRKKEREKEQQEGLHKLEMSNRELERRCHDLELERDFYRGERNRLRDIVLQTPGISEWADRGPPSPTSTRSQGYTTEGSPMTGPLHAHPPASSYPTGDTSMLERPARRRRTDSEPQFTMPTYATQQPTTLPPIPSSAYGINPSPHTSSSTGSARLPPLRLDQPSTSGAPSGGGGGPPPPPLPPQTQPPYPPHGRATYEAGWPTPRRTHDGSQR